MTTNYKKVYYVSDLIPLEGSDPISIGSYVITKAGERGRKRVTEFVSDTRVAAVDDPYDWNDWND